MKVLIVSHNPMTTHNNMGKTMATLFRAFAPEELCHLYVYPTIPDIDRCASYYRITDKDVLKSYYRFGVKGRVIEHSEIDTEQHALYENAKDEALYRNKKNKTPLRVLLRDCMWKFSRWYGKGLEDWIREQKPTHLFLAPGAAKFIYDVAMKIAKKHHLPIITYICDDYYFVKPSGTLLGRIQQKALRRKMDKTLGRTRLIITICRELEKLYGEKFKVPTVTVMTGSDFPVSSAPRERAEIGSLVYMGNIRCNRYLSLAKIGRALDEINDERGTAYTLKIYSGQRDADILEVLEPIRSVEFCGFVSGEAFRQAFEDADMLLHVEAFDEESVDLVKHSVSTKIADSLSSGIPFFAFAPDSIASMGYLLRNDCALTCTDAAQLKEKLCEALDDKSIREATVARALELAHKNHDGASVGEKIKSVIALVSA